MIGKVIEVGTETATIRDVKTGVEWTMDTGPDHAVQVGDVYSGDIPGHRLSEYTIYMRDSVVAKWLLSGGRSF